MGAANHYREMAQRLAQMFPELLAQTLYWTDLIRTGVKLFDNMIPANYVPLKLM